ncbi:MAG: ribosome recycling factor [Dehalococcoidia bacterium]|nr:ribosome recycling factor [Dehalococcoidia bacterium]HCV00193.1 ribosome recycling factor [Dehalococcoidia bacterium]|tara:strand:+ start:12203 stop:12772 length:570 start_codon:yes stop_codon:yes gene_type:complete
MAENDPEEIMLDAEMRMESAVEAFQRELAGVRTGRAHPSLIEGLQVEHYGQTQALNQLGTINAPEARLLAVQVWDAGAVQSVVKALQASDLGLNPNIDGQLIRLPIPQLTEERRREYAKLVHQKAEDARVSVRNVRRHKHDELRKSEKSGDMTQDDLHDYEGNLQKLTDTHTGLIDVAMKRKEEELLEL